MDPRVEALYPADLNQDLPRTDANPWLLRLPQSMANEIIVPTNVAAIRIENVGNQLVQRAREYAKEVVLKRKAPKGMGLSDRLKIEATNLTLALFGVSEEAAVAMVKAQLRELITGDKLGLHTDSSAKYLRGISKYVGTTFNGIELNADYIGSAMALDDLNIHPDVSIGLKQAYGHGIQRFNKNK